MDLEVTAEEIKCGNNSGREDQEKSKEEMEDSSGVVDMSPEDEEGSTEISFEMEDASSFSNEPNYLSYADPYS